MLPFHPLLDKGGDVVSHVRGKELKGLAEEREAHRSRRKLPIASGIPPAVDPMKEAYDN